MPSIQCPHCAAKLNVNEAALGKHGRCPKCQQKFLLQLPKAADEYGLAQIHSPAPISSPSTLTPSKPAAATMSQPATITKDPSPADEPNKSLPVWLIPAAIGGALLAFSMLALVVWLGFSFLGGGGGTSGNAQPGDSSTGSMNDAGRIAAPARKATAGGNSSVPSVTIDTAAPAMWNVTPDGTELPQELRSLTPLEGMTRGSLGFPRPDLAQAAILEPVFRPSDTTKVFDWVQVDLRGEQPPARIHLWKEETPRDDVLQGYNDVAGNSWSLSRSGERMAITGRAHVWVWAKDGSLVAKFPVKGVDNAIPWLAFGGEETIWLRWKDKLRQYLISSGELVHTSDEKLYSDPTLTPGGNYLLAVTNNGLVALSAADGSQAGVLMTPPGFGTNLAPALNPAGTKVALAMANQRADALFVVYDLATGKFERAVEQTYARVQQRLVEYRLAWLGDELLLVNHTYFHLGLGEILAGEFRVDALPNGPSPDGRLWQVRPIIDPKQAEQLGEQPPTDGNVPMLYLTAASMPPPQMQSVLNGTSFSWHPGIAVKAELLGVPQKYKDGAANGLSDWLAREGFTVDPEAKIRIELTVKREADGETTGNKIPQEQMTPAMKEHLRTHQHEEWVELLTMKNLVVQGKVYDASGQPAFQVPARLISRAIDKGGSDDPVWQALANWQEPPPLPKTFFRDSSGKRIFLPSKYIVPGADGVIDAVIEPPDPGPFTEDRFKLPGE